MLFSLIIPCFNEEENIPYVAKKLKKIIQKTSYEVILVDNGSKDKTLEKINYFFKDINNVKILRIPKNEGYGNGILKGLEIARGEILAWTHADMQTDPNDVLEGLKYFKEHSGKVFVKGNRYGRPLKDIFFTMGMSFFVSLVLKKFLWDINAQPTIFPSKFFKNWDNPPKDFSLDLYSYFLASKKGYKIIRFPVLFDKRLFGVSNWNTDFRSKMKFIKRTIKFTFKLRNSMK